MATGAMGSVWDGPAESDGAYTAMNANDIHDMSISQASNFAKPLNKLSYLGQL